jgi:hypothetical protein
MATCQEPRQVLEFQLRTLNHHGGSAVRSVRPLYHFASTRHWNCVSRCRSSLASDDDYTLFTVIIFRKVYDAFIQKCRENKYEKICRPIHTLLAFSHPRLLRYVVRDFRYSSDQIDKEREELQTADTAEKELWVSFASQRSLVNNPVINYRRSSFGFQRSTFRRLSKLSCTSR